MAIRSVVLCVFVLSTRLAFAVCPVERGAVRSATDPGVSDVRPIEISTTIATLHSIPMPQRPLPQDDRLAPVETTIHSIAATLVAHRMTPEGEIQFVLSDEQKRTITAVIPLIGCAAGSPLLASITTARAEFIKRAKPKEQWTETRQAIEVRGVGFWDFLQSQKGLAPNGVSLQPVTFVNFFPTSRPPAPPVAGRRRAVGSGGTTRCVRPQLSLATSRSSACAGESVTIAWTASDGSARVDIGGIGDSLGPSGSQVVSASASTIFSGTAQTACGRSDEATTVVTLSPGASASLSGPSSVAKDRTATLSVAISALSSWNLTSSLANSISPSIGTSSTTATYTARRAGTDTVTLSTFGGACGNLTRTLTIVVSEAPSGGGTIRCCDGTLSPSCTSCTQGCCSGHGGCKSCN